MDVVRAGVGRRLVRSGVLAAGLVGAVLVGPDDAQANGPVPMAGPGPAAVAPLGAARASASGLLPSGVDVVRSEVRATGRLTIVPKPAPGGPATWRSLATDPRVHLTITTTYYRVTGSTPAEINASMNRAGPKAIGSKNAIGEFRSRDRINYVMLDRGSSCSLSSFTITHAVTVTLPRWRPDQAASADTRRWWAETLRDIVQHEQEHTFIAAVQIRAMPSQLDRLPSTGSCSAMRTAVNHVSDRRWAAANRLNDDFDTWTHNGTTGPYWLG